MIAANNFTERSNEIRELVATANVERAIKRMMDLARDFCVDVCAIDEVTVISFNFSQLAIDERRGTLTYDDASTKRNGLIYRMFSLLRELESSLVRALAA
jgi:hypothetical protein